MLILLGLMCIPMKLGLIKSVYVPLCVCASVPLSYVLTLLSANCHSVTVLLLQVRQ